MNKISKFISIVYAVLLMVGGVMGFLKAHSKMSLITGILSGILVFLSYNLGKKNPKSAYLYICTISLCLGVFFLYRFSLNHAIMPGGFMFLFSITTFVVAGLSFLKEKKS